MRGTGCERRARCLRRVAFLGCVVLGVALTAGVASAHELDATAFAVPIPLPLLYAGAGATVAVTAGWLGWGDRSRVHPTERADAERTGSHLPPAWAHPARLLARSSVLVLFAVALGHGIVGPTAPAENLATAVLWPLALKGVAIVAVVTDSPWRTISPWETLYDLLVALEGDRLAVFGDYPRRLGTWPAVVGFVLGVGVLENLTVATRSPTLTVAIAGGYASIMLLGGVAFGREWFARADALTVLFSLLGRASTIQVERTADGGAEIALRPPWAGCVAPVVDDATVVFVVATVYTVSFDGFTATATFETLRLAVADVTGLGSAGMALFLAGFGLFVLSYLVAATLASRLAATIDFDGPRAARAFAGSIVPIAAAYEVAHNYPFVAVNLGQAVGILRGFVPGAAVEPVALIAWLPVSAFWVSQVVLVVGGHVVGVVAAHNVASRWTGTVADARRSHAPLVVVMVFYTVLSLWVISQPLAS